MICRVVVLNRRHALNQQTWCAKSGAQDGLIVIFFIACGQVLSLLAGGSQNHTGMLRDWPKGGGIGHVPGVVRCKGGL